MENNIKLLRAQHGFTQEELALKIGISRPALSDIENKKVIPSGRVMIRMANIFGISAEKIFFENTVIQEEQNTKI